MALERAIRILEANNRNGNLHPLVDMHQDTQIFADLSPQRDIKISQTDIPTALYVVNPQGDIIERAVHDLDKYAAVVNALSANLGYQGVVSTVQLDRVLKLVNGRESTENIVSAIEVLAESNYKLEIARQKSPNGMTSEGYLVDKDVDIIRFIAQQKDVQGIREISAALQDAVGYKGIGTMRQAHYVASLAKFEKPSRTVIGILEMEGKRIGGREGINEGYLSLQDVKDIKAHMLGNPSSAYKN